MPESVTRTIAAASPTVTGTGVTTVPIITTVGTRIATGRARRTAAHTGITNNANTIVTAMMDVAITTGIGNTTAIGTITGIGSTTAITNNRPLATKH
jgi:hypothetical protein